MARKGLILGLVLCTVVLLGAGIAAAADIKAASGSIAGGGSAVGAAPGEIPVLASGSVGATIAYYRTWCYASSSLRTWCKSSSRSTRRVSMLRVSSKMCVESTCSTWLPYTKYNFYGLIWTGHYYDTPYYRNYYAYGRHQVRYAGVTYAQKNTYLHRYM